MNHRLLSIPFILIITLVASFNYNTIENIDYIVYGYYCGECYQVIEQQDRVVYGKCSKMYKLDNDQLLVDSTGSFLNDQDSYIQGNFKGKKLNQEIFDSAKILKQKFPEFLLKSENKTFGIPDAYDQCGIFLQVFSNEKRRTFLIDTNLEAIPPELRDYTKLLVKISKFRTL